MIAVEQLVAVAMGHASDTFDDEAAVAELHQLADGDHQTLERAITGVHGAAGQPGHPSTGDRVAGSGPLRAPTSNLTQANRIRVRVWWPAARRSVQGHATHRLHAMAPGRMGQTIERAEGHHQQHAAGRLAAPAPFDNLG